MAAKQSKKLKSLRQQLKIILSKDIESMMVETLKKYKQIEETPAEKWEAILSPTELSLLQRYGPIGPAVIQLMRYERDNTLSLFEYAHLLEKRNRKLCKKYGDVKSLKDDVAAIKKLIRKSFSMKGVNVSGKFKNTTNRAIRYMRNKSPRK